MISGHFPASEETLQHLAALRLQYLHGDGAGRVGWSLGTVYPIGRLRNRILHSTKPGVGAASGAGARGSGGIGDGMGALGGPAVIGAGTEKRKTPSFLDGTLRRSFKTGSLKKQKVSDGAGDSKCVKVHIGKLIATIPLLTTWGQIVPLWRKSN